MVSFLSLPPPLIKSSVQIILTDFALLLAILHLAVLTRIKNVVLSVKRSKDE